MRACVPRRVGPRSLPYLPIARGVRKAPLGLVPDTLSVFQILCNFFHVGIPDFARVRNARRAK